MVFENCPICLERMLEADRRHPLQCEQHCGYNFCQSCVQSFISSSNDDYLESSDGNRHVKVYLQCPNCRSDLTKTIHNTLLLRKVGAFKAAQAKNLPLNESQQRLAKVVDSDGVRKAIRQAQKEEDIYFGRTSEYLEASGNSPSDVEYQEWGVEADLHAGVHDSILMLPPISKREIGPKIDNTLFSGLDEVFDNDDQRRVITEQMTSGDPDEVSQAAHFLWLKALHPKRFSALEKKKKRSPHMRRSSVLGLIEEARHARMLKETKANDDSSVDTHHSSSADTRRVRIARHKQLGRELRQKATFQKRFPLPVRMPKAIELQLPLTDELDLMDYEWDGTVLDAYLKISVGFGYTIEKIDQKLSTENEGVRTILGDGTVPIELPGQSRIIICNPGSQAGKQGAVRGDVVTHVNGESVAGKTAGEIMDLLQQRQPQNNGGDVTVSGETICDYACESLKWLTENSENQPSIEKSASETPPVVVLTLNAERSVAEALKRRAMAISEHSSKSS